MGKQLAAVLLIFIAITGLTGCSSERTVHGWIQHYGDGSQGNFKEDKHQFTGGTLMIDLPDINSFPKRAIVVERSNRQLVLTHIENYSEFANQIRKFFQKNVCIEMRYEQAGGRTRIFSLEESPNIKVIGKATIITQP